ncbi:glycosyltransferase [Bacillus licheniformis]
MSTHTGQSSNGFWLKKRSNPRAEQHDEVRHAKGVFASFRANPGHSTSVHKKPHGEKTNEKRAVLFSYGRFVPEKGFIELLHVFQQLRKRRPDLELVIAGEGPLQSGIETKARELGIKESVTILPFLCEEEIVNWLGFCEMAVFPSSYEPFGIAAQESMAAGAAVAVGNKGDGTISSSIG